MARENAESDLFGRGEEKTGGGRESETCGRKSRSLWNILEVDRMESEKA